MHTQVFDGHGGTDAANFVRKNILKLIIEDGHFPVSVEKAMKDAFVRADHAFADACSLDSSSGTTALTVIIFGRLGLILNFCWPLGCLLKHEVVVHVLGIINFLMLP